MDTNNRLLMEACVGFFNSMNLCYKQYDKEMRQMRLRFYNRLESKIRANIRIHQLNLMNIIEVLYLNELNEANTNRQKKKRIRTLWMKKRSADWWNSISLSGDDDLWARTFRMDQETYLYLFETLDDELKAKPNAVRESVPTKIKIAAALYKLASNESYSSIGVKFGIHGISVQKALYQFCEACTKVLENEYIAMPEGEEIFDIMQQFEDKVTLPQMLGVLEGTRISISYKAIGLSKHMREKGSTEVVLQTVIDPNCLFRDVAFLDNAEDFTDYNFDVKQVMSSMPQRDISGIPVPAYLISRRADAAQSWLMKPYSDVITPEQELFNDFLSKSCAVAEQTFRKLKGRWKILQEPMNITAKGMEYNTSLSDSLDYEDVLYSGPVDESDDSCATGEAIRDHLKNFISSQFT